MARKCPLKKGGILMNTSNESVYFTAVLVLFGVLAFYGGWWLGLLILAALLVWLIASAHCQARRVAIDARVDNRSMKAVGR
jgi:hypothetical protein